MKLKLLLGFALCAYVQPTSCMNKIKIHPSTPLPQTKKETTPPQGAFELFSSNMNRLMLQGKNKEIAQTILDKAQNKELLCGQKNTSERKALAKKLIKACILEKYINHLKRPIIQELTQEAMFKHVPAITTLVIQGLTPPNRPAPTITRNVIGVPRH